MCQYMLFVECIQQIPFINDFWPQSSQWEGKKKNRWKSLSYFCDLNIREQSTVAHYLGMWNLTLDTLLVVPVNCYLKSQSPKFEMKMYLHQNDIPSSKWRIITWHRILEQGLPSHIWLILPLKDISMAHVSQDFFLFFILLFLSVVLTACKMSTQITFVFL